MSDPSPEHVEAVGELLDDETHLSTAALFLIREGRR